MVFGRSYKWREAQTLFTKQTLDEVIHGESLEQQPGTGSAASWCCQDVQGNPKHLWDSPSFTLRKGSLKQGEQLPKG